MIGIIDYGSGNLRSVLKAFDYLGLPSKIVAATGELKGASRIVVPGVGAFGAAVERLDASGFREALVEWSAAGRPLLGICLGMQLMLDASEESPGWRGLGLIPGGNRKLTAGKVPQIGWNRVTTADDPLFAGLPADLWFYFVHSYYAAPADDTAVIATAAYGIVFPAALRSGSAVGVQFHPEKSGQTGLAMLQRWGRS